MDTDILGAPYERRILTLAPDDEGEVVATLIRRRAATPTRRAVLYIHGYVDYFFQTHLADFYVERGWDFYAIDMRKYGRSLLQHQSPNFCRDLSEYFTELDQAARIIREEDGHDTLLVNGHSTGALVAVLWTHERRDQAIVQGLFLNSPFFDFNEAWLVRRGLAPLVSRIGIRRPYRTMPKGLGSVYGMTLHRNHHGEWDYDLTMKPVEGFQVYFGWIRAIRAAHRRVQRGLAIDVPILVECSARSYRKSRFADAAHHADAVLNVRDMLRWSPGLGPKVTVARIEGGKHDLMLSPKTARDEVLAVLDRWLADNWGTTSAPGLDQPGLPGSSTTVA